MHCDLLHDCPVPEILSQSFDFVVEDIEEELAE